MAFNPPDINHFKFWCQKILPLVYDDSLSYMELLCKIVDYLNKVIDTTNQQTEYLQQLGATVEELQNAVNYLEEEIEKVKNGDYVSLYLDSIINWINDNLQELVAKIVKYVFFVIDNDGYFNALIPYAWQFLEFDTGFDPSDSDTYLHLILYW